MAPRVGRAGAAGLAAVPYRRGAADPGSRVQLLGSRRDRLLSEVCAHRPLAAQHRCITAGCGAALRSATETSTLPDVLRLAQGEIPGFSVELPGKLTHCRAQN